MKEVHLLIEGRVQHVGFRRFVLRYAELLNLSGWVRNKSDGSVELYAEGEQANIVSFIEQCRKGPLFASVFNIDFLPVTRQDKSMTFSGMFKVVCDD